MAIGMVLGVDLGFTREVVLQLYALAVVLFVLGGIGWSVYRLVKILVRIGKNQK